MKLSIVSFFALIFLSAFVMAEGLSQQDMENIQRLRAEAEAKRLDEDLKSPVKILDKGDRASDGSNTAPLTIYAFSDFQCPYCKNGAQTVDEIKKRYGKKVRVQFRHMPLSFHQQAMPAARRFEALAMQSPKLAYRFHDEVFKEQERLQSGGEAFLDSVVKKVGGDVVRMKRDLESSKITERINQDMAEAQKLGITGTPAFIIGGVRLFGAYPADAFAQIIDRRLAQKR